MKDKKLQSPFDVIYEVSFPVRRDELEIFEELGRIYETPNFGEIVKRAVVESLIHNKRGQSESEAS